MIVQNKGPGIFVLVARTLPVLCHIAYLVFIVDGMLSDRSFKEDLILGTYFVLATIGHSLCLIFHCIAHFEEGDLDWTVMFIRWYVWSIIAASIPGWFIFSSHTGKIITDYIHTYGFAEWQTLSLLIKIVYFNMWVAIAIVTSVVLLVLVGCLSLVIPFPPPQQKPAPLIAISTIPPLVAVSDVPPLIS
ncbi:hypothetical protein BDR26DRAFT_214760 [Obelidium mucronatum]|nr:hypothetical protein BDR26DRAFT_214760 [Obelidium mucronatum]